MKTLLLMRHAKSDQTNGETDESHRPLTPKGERRATEMGMWIQKQQLTPEIILSSSSLRACRTAELVAEASGYTGELRSVEELNMAEANEILEVLRSLPDEIERVMIVGHNPGLESLIPFFTHEVEALPHAGVAVLNLKLQNWQDLRHKTRAKLKELWRAKKISPNVDLPQDSEPTPPA
jgi:phosphohistidine phosphatase